VGEKLDVKVTPGNVITGKEVMRVTLTSEGKRTTCLVLKREQNEKRDLFISMLMPSPQETRGKRRGTEWKDIAKSNDIKGGAKPNKERPVRKKEYRST